MHSRLLPSLLFVLLAAAPAHSQTAADGWITHAEALDRTPIVLRFRREVEFDRIPREVPVTITADNRFVLWINGQRVASGPSTGTVASWRYRTLDVARWLRRGDNLIEAVVWNFGDAAPLAQQSVATGFRMTGGLLSTAEPGWRVKIETGHSALKGSQQIPWQYYVASAPEVIDARKPAGDWQDAIAAPRAAARTLVADPLPAQAYLPAPVGRMVRSTLPGAGRFPGRAVVIPARTTTRLLLQREAMISAYPVLEMSGGRDATIKLHYAEALYDAQRRKGDRNEIGERQLLGFFDTFIADGSSRSFAPLWWRTFRYLEIEVTTADEPLTLQALQLFETGYPFPTVANFDSDDRQLNRLWEVGWRTLRVDAHETFMDSSYWEQLQYTGDTRLQMLISYAVSGDARLALQAIDAFAESDRDGGLVDGRYPTREPNVIATFSFAWVGMLADWSMEQPDSSVVRRHLPRMRKVLDWFAPWRNAHGLLTKNPQWNFIDWAGQRWDDHDTFPSWGRDGGSCLMTALWLGALRQGAALEAAYGDAARAAANTASADQAREAIRAHCWSPQRGLYADNPNLDVFSQHMNVFAVLYDIANPDERRDILERITVRGRGIDAPPEFFTSTYYFAWYLVRAFEHGGLAERYFALLQTWRELLALNYTTWPESRGEPRSDTHAWSAHPTADLLGIVAGIRPAAPGYARLRIAPVLGHLKRLDATAATPQGPVRVRYRLTGGKLSAQIDKPATLPGDFVWRGKSYPLEKSQTRLTLDTGPVP